MWFKRFLFKQKDALELTVRAYLGDQASVCRGCSRQQDVKEFRDNQDGVGAGLGDSETVQQRPVAILPQHVHFVHSL